MIGLTIGIEQFIVCFRGFRVGSSEFKNLRQEVVSPVLDVG